MAPIDLFDLFCVISIKDEYSDGINSASTSVSNFSDKLKSGLATAAKVGAAAITAASAAVTAFAKSSIDAGAQFDSSMSQVAATMGTTVDQIAELRDFAMEMGAKTAFSASQAADALNYMALAGYDADQSMQALPNVLNLAAAGGIELAAASDMVTDAQSALGLSMEESAELVDKMAKASSKSNTSVAQLGEAILTIGATAKGLSGGTTELSTALGILADNGIKGAEGGTHLRNVILALQSPTDNASALMKSLGISVYDSAGEMRGLDEILGDLNESMEGMTTSDKDSIISTIFNKTDLAAVNALLSNTGQRWNELTGYINDATGAAEAMAVTQLDNLNGDITLFKSALEGVQISLSDKLKPTIRTIVQEATNFLSTFDMDAAVATVENLIDTFVSLTPVIAAAAAAVGAYKTAMAISSLVDAAVKSIKAYQTANEGATAAQALLNTTLLANPFVLVTTLVAALGAALVTLYMTNEDFRNKVNAAWVAVKETVSGVVSSLVTFFTETVPNAGREMLEFFKSIPGMALQWGQDLIQNFINGIKEKISALKDTVSNVAQTVKDFLGFSEPKEGPLSNFHTYAPDMMRLFANGIKDNSGLIRSAFNDSLDFGTANVDFASSGLGMSSAGIINSVSAAGADETGGTTTINLVLQDGSKIASWQLPYLIKAAQAAGTPIASGQYA